MLPSLPRQALRSLPTSISCSQLSVPHDVFTPAARCLSTSARLSTVHIPPESPKYIKVPQPPQSVETDLPPVKGHLPVPRQVFRHRDSQRKLSAPYLQRAASVPSPENAAKPPSSDIVAWQRRMADSRRVSLSSGLQGLWARKQKSDAALIRRSRARFERNLRAANAPERADDLLTRSSVPQSTLVTEVATDPDRMQAAADSRARTAAIQQAKSEARKDALQELYAAAQNFIVTEEQLEAKVDIIFNGDEYWSKQGYNNSHFGGQNVWTTEGTQPRVSELYADAMRLRREVVERTKTEQTRTVNRQKKLSEELTGGKME